MGKRIIEHQPYYRAEPPPEFGQPLKRPKIGRRASSRRSFPNKPEAPTYELGLVPAQDLEMKSTLRPVVEKREWEKYILDKGMGTQETIEGRSYTIGKDHAPVDVYIFPPDKPEGIRVGAVKLARIIALKPPKEPRREHDLHKLSKRWTDVVVLQGVSKRPVEEPVLFNNGYGQSMVVQAQWRDIRRNP